MIVDEKRWLPEDALLDEKDGVEEIERSITAGMGRRNARFAKDLLVTYPRGPVQFRSPAEIYKLRHREIPGRPEYDHILLWNDMDARLGAFTLVGPTRSAWGVCSAGGQHSG